MSKPTPGMENVIMLPVWHKGGAAEWFREMAVIADLNPERFNKVVLCYEEALENGRNLNDYYCHNVTTTEMLGILELSKDQCMTRTRR